MVHGACWDQRLFLPEVFDGIAPEAIGSAGVALNLISVAAFQPNSAARPAQLSPPVKKLLELCEVESLVEVDFAEL